MFDAFVWRPTCLGAWTHPIRGSLLAARPKQARLAFSMVQQLRGIASVVVLFIQDTYLITIFIAIVLFYLGVGFARRSMVDYI